MPKFYKLKREDNAYNVIERYRREYHPVIVLNDEVNRCLDFAYDMTFGGKGEHRPHRTGGTEQRSNIARFQNAFQGKLAECGLYRLFQRKHLRASEPDFKTYGRGEWDDCDLTIGDTRISVKSAAHFSQLLLLERNDWDENGYYIPDHQTEESAYDYFVLCRIRPNVKDLFRDMTDEQVTSKATLIDVIQKVERNWEMDIPGYITRDDLKELIREHFVLPQGAMLNGRMRMDAANYYCRAYDMRWFSHLIEELGGHD